MDDETIKSELSLAQPYGKWLEENLVRLSDLPESGGLPGPIDKEELLDLQQAFGYTTEDLRILMEPMAIAAAEPTGSMGNDSPLAVLSDQPQSLFRYFKQLFAQVSNPPLDSLREELVTSVAVRLGAQRNLFDAGPEHARQLRLDGPVITDLELAKIKTVDKPGLKATTLSTLFDVTPGDSGMLERAMDALCARVDEAMNDGTTHLFQAYWRLLGYIIT